MKAPWINYEEIKRINIIQQTQSISTVAQEPYNSPHDKCTNDMCTETDESLVPSLQKRTDECEKAGICQVVQEIKETQTNLIESGQTSPIDCFTEINDSKYIADPAQLKQSTEMDSTLQTTSRFYLDYSSEPNLAPSHIEVNHTHDLIKLDANQSETKQMGITQLVNTLKNVQTSLVAQINDGINSQAESEPMRSSIPDTPSRQIEVDNANRSPDNRNENRQIAINHLVHSLKKVLTSKETKTDYMIDSQSETEPMPSSIPDTPPSQIEVDNANELSNNRNENRQIVINHLVHSLKKVLTSKETKTDYMIDSQTETEPMRSSIPDTPPSQIEVDNANELSNNRDENRQIAINHLVHSLKKAQISKDAKTDYGIDSQSEIEPIPSSIPDTPPSQIEVDNANELFNNRNENRRIAISHLVHSLKKVLTSKETKTDYGIDSQIKSGPMRSSIPDTPPSQIEVDNANELSSNRNENRQIAINHLVHSLKKVLINKDTETTRLIDSKNESKPAHTSESDAIDADDTNEIGSTDVGYISPQSSNVYCKTIQSPFSTIVTLDDFLHAPLFGEVSQNTFTFLDSSDTQSVQVDTRFISTSAYYPAQPSCHLVRSTIHEIIYLTNTPHGPEKQLHSKSTLIPIHPTPKTGQLKHTDDFIKIRVPVVVGEYTIEMCIEEEVLFEEENIRIKEISKNIILKNCHFTPTQFATPLQDGACAAATGILSLEGVIEQQIKYIPSPDTNKNPQPKIKTRRLHEKITLELIIQLLQEQAIRVNYKN